MIQPTAPLSNSRELQPIPAETTAWGRTWRDISDYDDRSQGFGCFCIGALIAFLISNIFLWSFSNSNCISQRELKLISSVLLVFSSIPIMGCIAIALKHLCNCRSEGYVSLP